MKRNENCFGCHELPIKIVHKGVYKSTKICLTCNIARPFRSNHCSDCDNCTLRFDHHCPWIGGCVGKRNYIYFFLFLVFLNIKNIYLLIFSIIHISKTYIDTSEEEKKVKKWVARKLLYAIPSLFTIIFIGATMLFTAGLIIYHINLIITNKTTKEEIKKILPLNIGNPYDRGISNNCSEFWTRHKSMEDHYTVKELRVKTKVEKKISKVTTKRFKPKIMPYSEKEKQLKNKKKRDADDIKDKFYSQNSDIYSNTQNSKSDKKSENTDNQSNSYSDNNNKDNNQIINKIKKRVKNKKPRIIERSNSNSNSQNSENNRNSRKSSKKSSSKKSNSKKTSSKKTSSKNSEKNENNKVNDIDNFSDAEISDENENSNRKICNTSVKNRNNLNSNVINKLNDIDFNKIRFKTYINEKNFNVTNEDKDLSYKIAQQRLEEMSSEITIHEEINQLKSSLSIPRENSCTSSLSQS